MTHHVYENFKSTTEPHEWFVQPAVNLYSFNIPLKYTLKYCSAARAFSPSLSLKGEEPKRTALLNTHKPNTQHTTAPQPIENRQCSYE